VKSEVRFRFRFGILIVISHLIKLEIVIDWSIYLVVERRNGGRK